MEMLTLMDIPGTFAEISSKLFDSIAPSGSGDIIFSTDQYKPVSIKSLERKRCGCGEKLIIGSGATSGAERPPDWKLFLTNDDNKVQFIRLLLKLWSSDDYAVKLQGRKIILVCEDSAHLLTSDDGITTKIKELPLLKSSQEETDTRVVLYTQYAANSHYNTVRIKSPDSDIFFILLHFASTMDINILFDTKIQRRSRLINVTSIAADIGQEKCTVLLGLHGFTGSDTSSAFRGKGKLVPVKKMLKAPKFVPMLAKLGDNWTVSEDLIDDLEAFTCAMYGDNTTAGKVDALRLNRINKLCTKQGKSIPVNVDMSSLPPCRKSLTQHIRRVNF
ncbi:hypothetical protein ACEWY4_012640 [Coilia grayii]|uniref:Uncharacterized protein n=1 Tax=Coilia grayii TaxID=363190 RepID=A0ABD1K144_9TELE